jgi:ppGpp synthetase/RelA/SpoT-type nucleotidyltranferase
MDLLKEYDRRIGNYGAFTQCVISLIQTLLLEADIRPHSVTGRVKERSRLEAKLKRSNKNYRSLDQVTDISGIRIITYFTNDVDLVANLVEKEFIVDKENSVDKRIYSDPDRFGYTSLHYVVSLSPMRLDLSEYRRFSGYKAEIQIRTVIQHAWAEIEHDLGYKGEIAIPKAVRRKFFRLAAMLELADEEFTWIKETLSKYKKEVGERIATTPEKVEIDATSIMEYINNSPVLNSCDREISTRTGLLIEDPAFISVQADAAYLRWIRLYTVEELDTCLKENKDAVVSLAAHRLKGTENKSFIRGLSLLYICYVILARKADLELFMQFYHAFNFGTSHGSLEDITREIIAFIKEYDEAAQRGA